VAQDTPPPAPTNIPDCGQISGQEAGKCVRITGQRSCQPSCHNQWSASPSEPDVECVEVKCDPCGNNNTCCRKRPSSPPPTSPPTIPPTTPPISTPTPTIPYTLTTPTNPPTRLPTPTSTPTPTPTNTPTPTPTIIYVTATPAPTGSARYQSPIRDNVGYIWVCLKTEAYSGNEYGAGLDHRLKVSGQLPHSYNQDIYIVGCVTKNQSVYCTTGNDVHDQSLHLNRLTQHTFQVIHPQNPFKIPTNTNQIEAYVRSTTRDFMTHTVYAVYVNPSSGINVGQGGLQQATTVFSSNAKNECILIKWDPRGRVLDYYTKKPIANIEISLVNEKGKKIVEPGLVNPYKTNEDGQFNFYVDERENNLYRLKIDLPSGYQLIGQSEAKNIPQEFKDESKYIIYHPELKIRGDEKKEVIIFLKPKRDNILIRILRFFVE
jgi:5-hydroxyisourate hydrolase-like protein (transthyretin family)